MELFEAQKVRNFEALFNEKTSKSKTELLNQYEII